MDDKNIIDCFWSSGFGQCLGNDIELPTSYVTGTDNEGAVAATLWDIFDQQDDNLDTLRLGPNEIWDVFKNYRKDGRSAYTIVDFYDGWFNCPGCSSQNHGQKSNVDNIFYEHKTNNVCYDYDLDGYYNPVCGGNDCNDWDVAINPSAPEICDNVDNNCNGQKDEGFDRDSDGYTSCGGDCSDNDPTIFPGAPDLCDNKDNDCDGQTDEGCSCTDGQTRSCGSNVGECRYGTQTCSSGAWGSCAGGVTPAPEVCPNDGRDNDCDGSVDEDSCGGGQTGFGLWNYPSSVNPGNPLLVSVNAYDSDGINSVTMKYDYGNNGNDGSVQMQMTGALSVNGTAAAAEPGLLAGPAASGNISAGLEGEGDGPFMALGARPPESFPEYDTLSGSYYTYGRSVNCRGVQSSPPYDPIQETSVFKNDDPVYTWTRLTGLYKPARTKCVWKRPDGSVKGTAISAWTPNGYYPSWEFWSWYNPGQLNNEEGRWSVEIYVEENYNGVWRYEETRQFTLNYELTDHTMAKSVQSSSPYDPIERTSDFTTGDTGAYSWLKLENVRGSHQVMWEWYNPSWNLYSTATSTIPDPESQGYQYWSWSKPSAMLYMRGHTPASTPGTWTVRVYVDGEYKYQESFNIHPSGGRYEGSVPPAGNYYAGKVISFQLVERDRLGNEWWSDTRTVRVSDNVPPEAGVQGSPSNWQNTNAVAYMGCSDPGSGCDPSTFRFATYPSNPGSCPGSYNSYGTASPLSVGEYMWVCGTAKDCSGNIGYSQPAEFKIDKSAPQVSISANNGNACVNSQLLTLGLSYSNTPSGIKDCRYGNEGQFGAWEPCSASKQWLLSPGTGAKVVTYQTRDNAGNVGESSVSLVLDTSPPGQPTISPVPGWVNSTTIQVSFSAPSDDGCGLNATWYSLDNSAWISPGLSTVFQLDNLSEGLHSVRVRANDVAGNTGSASEVSFGVDTVAPFIAILSPQNRTYSTRIIELKPVVSENASVFYSLNSGQEHGLEYPYNTTINASPGGNNLTVRAADPAGNSNSTIQYFRFRFPGDVNNDLIVDILDMAITCMAFGSVRGEGNWNPDADIDENGRVDIFDVTSVGLNFCKEY